MDFSTFQYIKPFLNGGMAGMAATCCIQPIDMVKVRIQTGETGNPFTIGSRIAAKEGVTSLYKGLSAGLLRQAFYTTTRLGLYRNCIEYLRGPSGQEPGFLAKAGVGLFAGATGALAGCPADVALIRMQTDMQLPAGQRRGYKNVFDALYSIVKTEGVPGLYTGAGPTMARAMGLNMGMLVSYDETKRILKSSAGLEPTEFTSVFISSAVAGFFASACSLPADFVKTQLQRQKPDADGLMPFRGALHCAAQTYREGGAMKFYTGFPTYYCRIAPHAMLTLLFVEGIGWIQKTQLGV